MRRFLLLWSGLAALASLASLASLGALEVSSPVSLAVDPLPGSHTGPVTLSVSVPGGTAVRYRFLETPLAKTFPWKGPLVLDALPGESRSYTLRLSAETPAGESLTRDFRYTVSRAPVSLPTVRPAPGVWTGAVTVKAALPPLWSVTESGKPLSFPLVLDTAPGNRRTFVLEARGPGDRTLTWTYTVDRRDQEILALDVLSPAPGTWANPQALVLSFRGMDQVLWSYGSTLDPKTAQEYEGPRGLDRPGPQTITVSGRSRADGRRVEKTVSWVNGTTLSPVAGWPGSGAQVQGLDLPAAPGWEVSWDAGRSWQPDVGVHREQPSTVSRKVLSVLARRDGAVSRFVYWLDARLPLDPVLEFVGGWNPQLVFSGSPEVLHRVQWVLSDGKTVEEPQGLWGPQGSWKVPDGVVGAWVTGRGANGLATGEASLNFAETGWSTPEWEPWDQSGPQTDPDLVPLGGRVVGRPGFTPVYEVSDRPDVGEPGPGSAVLEGAFLPTVPWGSDRTFYVRFAWRDAAGLTGPGSPPVMVRVDRVPPSAPEVVEVPGQILVKPAEGEEDGTSLFWAVTTDRAASADALTFQPYQTALDSEALQAGSPKELWFHALAQDRTGNPGPARLNVALSRSSVSTASGPAVVQVDPDPSIGDTPVEDRGIYPWTEFRLRPLDQSRDLWVGLADQGAGVPETWANRLQPWTGVLSRAVGRGERRTFLVYWNAKTADGWAWPQPKTLVLTLDQGPPAAPLVSGTWPSAPLGGPWTLGIQPGRPGDSLRYSYSLDGSSPPDPLVAGQPWPGTLTWDAPALGKVVVRVRVAAVAVNGLGAEMPLSDAVTIDRSPPPAVAPALPPFTYRAGPLVIPAPGTPGLVRYAVTVDGSPPEVPTAAFPSVPPTGLVLDGAEGQTVLYRFRWRPYSAAGLPGPVSDTYAVLVDRTLAAVPAGTSDPTGRNVPVPRITGFPASGVSSVPVTLRAEGSPGFLRYEIREGVGEPRPVTLQSPLFDQTLTLDGGPGVDRSYALSVRGFSPEGSPVTDEVQYQVRVDRSIPSAPPFVIAADSRRPEALVRPSSENANPEEVFYYRWSWESFPQGQGQTDWNPLTGAPPVFSAPGGALTRLKVQAFLRDEAGNEGPVAERSLLIDQNVVYLAPGGVGDGTRDNPLGLLAAAVDKLHREGRTILFVAAGTFPLDRTIALDGIQVYGGWAPDLWETSPNPGRSSWVAAAPFSGTALVESGANAWSLLRIDLGSGAVSLPRAVSVRGAQVSLKAVSLNWAGTDVAWDQTGGTLDWSGVSAAYAAVAGGHFLRLDGVEATLRDVSLSATQNRGGVLFWQKDSRVMAQNLAVVSKKAVGYDGVWSVAGGTLTVDNLRVLAGEGADRSVAFLVKDAEVVSWNTDIALYGGLSNTGYQVAGGRLEIQKANLSLLKGIEFNQALVMDQADVSLRAFQLKVTTGAYQGGFDMNAGKLSLFGGRIQLAGGGQRVWGAQFRGHCLVTFQDLQWALETKTPGELWKGEKLWAEGSTTVGSTSTGW